jgi:hypothetical protein
MITYYIIWVGYFHPTELNFAHKYQKLLPGTPDKKGKIFSLEIDILSIKLQ